jgi:hypothetical protein
VRHADRDPADTRPGIEPGAERPEGAVVGRAREPGEAECCSQELAASVEHTLFDDLTCLQQHRRRDRQADCLGGLEVDDQLVPCRLLHGQVARLGPFEDLIHLDGGLSDLVIKVHGV